MKDLDRISRRSFVSMAAAFTATYKLRGEAIGASTGNDDLEQRWQRLDKTVRSWWDTDLRHADEDAIREDPKKTLLYLPFPYISGGGSESAFPEIYGWDTQFTNLALLKHDRADIVRWHILDQLTQIDRYGMVLNGNRSFYTTRGQPPLLPWSVENYLAARKDESLAVRSYPSLEAEYTKYWNGPTHITPIGLSTCRDLGSKTLTAPLAAECEAGLDFTPIFGGDVRRCVPIHVNVALVRYARVLGMLADQLGFHDQAKVWRGDAEKRAALINQYCWDDAEGCYFEYDYVAGKRLPCYSLNVFWPLWEGIASKAQAARVVEHLSRFDKPYGLAFTDKDYPNPYPQFTALEWAYPEAWPPQQIIAALALQRYGYEQQARDVSRRYIANVVTTWEKTGKLWERYNAVDGGHDVPVERAPARPLHGFSSAAAVVVGRIAFS